MGAKYKDSLSFEFEVKASAFSESDLSVAKASLEDLQPLIPDSVNLMENPDLLGIVCNAAMVNRFNNNGEGISSSVAASLVDHFKNKPLNIEHNAEQVVGHIINSQLVSLGEQKILSKEDAMATNDPFNISIAGVVYKICNKGFAKTLIDASDPESPMYKKISASWEMGYNDYVIALGSQILKDAEIVYDPKKISELSPLLETSGGPGVLKDGTPIYKLVVGRVFPLGVAFTTKPAAEVMGVYVDDGTSKKTHIGKSVEIEEKTTPNRSQNKKNTVNFNNMEINEIKSELVAEVSKLLDQKLGNSQPDFAEKAVASISSLISDKIVEKDKEFKLEREKIQEKEAKALQEASSTKASLDELKAKFKKQGDELEQLKKAIAEERAQSIFNARMDYFNSSYDLTDKDREFIATNLKGVGESDEQFDNYKASVASVLEHKNKDYIKKQKEDFDKAVAAKVAELNQSSGKDKCGGKGEVEDAVSELNTSKASLPNNNHENERLSFLEKFQKNFKREDQIEIK